MMICSVCCCFVALVKNPTLTFALLLGIKALYSIRNCNSWSIWCSCASFVVYDDLQNSFICWCVGWVQCFSANSLPVSCCWIWQLNFLRLSRILLTPPLFKLFVFHLKESARQLTNPKYAIFIWNPARCVLCIVVCCHTCKCLKTPLMYISYSKLPSGIPWNIPQVNCIFLVHAQSFRQPFLDKCTVVSKVKWHFEHGNERAKLWPSSSFY